MVDLSREILDLSGLPLLDGGKPVTVGAACIQALMATFQDEQNLQGVEKIRRYKLAMMLHGEKEASLVSEDVALIKTLVGKAYGPLIVGRIFEAIDPASIG